jgi:hypothetical protein
MIFQQFILKKIKILSFGLILIISCASGVHYAFFNNPEESIYYKVKLNEEKEASRIIKIFNDRIKGGSDY